MGKVFTMYLYGSRSKPYTPGGHQNSWDLWMFIPLKIVLIGIDPYPYNSIYKWWNSSKQVWLHHPKGQQTPSDKRIL